MKSYSNLRDFNQFHQFAFVSISYSSTKSLGRSYTAIVFHFENDANIIMDHGLALRL